MRLRRTRYFSRPTFGDVESNDGSNSSETERESERESEYEVERVDKYIHRSFS